MKIVFYLFLTIQLFSLSTYGQDYYGDPDGAYDNYEPYEEPQAYREETPSFRDDNQNQNSYDQSPKPEPVDENVSNSKVQIESSGPSKKIEFKLVKSKKKPEDDHGKKPKGKNNNKGHP